MINIRLPLDLNFLDLAAGSFVRSAVSFTTDSTFSCSSVIGAIITRRTWLTFSHDACELGGSRRWWLPPTRPVVQSDRLKTVFPPLNFVKKAAQERGRSPAIRQKIDARAINPVLSCICPEQGYGRSRVGQTHCCLVCAQQQNTLCSLLGGDYSWYMYCAVEYGTAVVLCRKQFKTFCGETSAL